MIAKDFSTRVHQPAQDVAAGALRKIIGDGTIGNVVRRLRFRLFGEGRGGLCAIDENVAVTYPRVKLQPAAFVSGDSAADSVLDRFDERSSFVAGDMAGREIA